MKMQFKLSPAGIPCNLIPVPSKANCYCYPRTTCVSEVSEEHFLCLLGGIFITDGGRGGGCGEGGGGGGQP